MTSEQRYNLDKKMSEFESFVEFHAYAYANNIIFDNEEWEEYSNKMKILLHEKKNAPIYIDTTGLILPNIHKE
jgi:hypothetical protein|tara:strand:- start:93 stop:311 length:219 start_codon:yes stop_codon:yes gene_type:complete